MFGVGSSLVGVLQEKKEIQKLLHLRKYAKPFVLTLDHDKFSCKSGREKRKICGQLLSLQ